MTALEEPIGTGALSRPGQFRRLVLLRWTLLLALTLILHTESGFEAFFQGGGAALGVLALTNMILLVAGPRITCTPGVALLLATTDTLIAAVVIFSAGVAAPEMLFLFALVIFLVALGHDLKRIVSGTLAVAMLYWWFGAHRDGAAAEMIATYLGRVAFLYCVALYFGFLVVDARQEKRESESSQKESKELRTIIDILEAATSSLDLHNVMGTIVGKICEVVPCDRCSVLFMDKNPDRGWVIASSDSPDVDMLSVDLRKYPEVRRAVASRTTVVVEDIETNPLMEAVREQLRLAKFNSLMVIPLIFQDEALGTLLLRAAKRKDSFTPEEIRFCQTVAGASVSALKNALLFREMRIEADKHRSTAEKLKNILENSLEVILTTDSDGKITDSNRSAESALGFTREELIGRPITDLLGTRVERRAFLGRLRRSTVVTEPTPLRRSDGNLLTLDFTFSVIRNELGEMVGTVCVGKDAGWVH
jgi:PAS domain S-box-containing protein